MRRLALYALVAVCLCAALPALSIMMTEEYKEGRIYPEARSLPLPKDITELMNFPGRVYGFNWFFSDIGTNEVLFFEGGPKMFARFLEQYSKLKIKSFTLYVHDGPPPKIWAMTKAVDKHYDWQYTRHLPWKPEEPETVFVEVWTYGHIDLSKVRIPSNIQVKKDVPKDSAPARAAAAEPDVVSWMDSGTGKVLFTTDDMDRFDWKQQIFELSREKAMDLMAFDFGLRRGFEVRDRDGLIYKGEFVSMLSSQTYAGPVIMPDEFEMPPLYRISKGYPGGLGQTSDERLAPRLHDDLQKLGLLKPIDLKNQPEQIQTFLAPEWVDLEKGIQVLAVAFPETFVTGKPARIHLIVNKSVEGAPGFTSVEAEAVLVQPDEEVFCAPLLTIKPSDISRSDYFRHTFIGKVTLSNVLPGMSSLVIRLRIRGDSQERVVETEPIAIVTRWP